MNTVDDSYFNRPPRMKVSLSAGGVVARLEENRVWIALVREKRYTDYILPKGGVSNRETLEEAACREIEEEAGLVGLKLLGKLGVQERMNFNKKAWKITHYFLFTTQQTESRPTDNHRSFICEWHPIDALPSFFWPEQKELVESNRQLIIDKLTSGS